MNIPGTCMYMSYWLIMDVLSDEDLPGERKHLVLLVVPQT